MQNLSYFVIALTAGAIASCASPTISDTEKGGAAVLSEKSQATLNRFEPTNVAVDCVSSHKIRKLKALSDDLFMVRTRGNKYYLNTPTTTCSRATNTTTALTYNLVGLPSLCSGEIVRVVSNRPGAAGTVLGTCALGEFREVQEKATE